MADIAWSAYALAMFTPAERAAAASATYVPDEPRRPLPPVLPPSPPLLPQSLGTIDPQQMFDDGFIYVAGQWVRPGSPEATVTGGSPRPTAAAFQSASTFGGGSVLGTQVPVAPPVLLPSFVGGRVGVVRQSGGLRPESGGTPRVVMLKQSLPWCRVVKGAGQ